MANPPSLSASCSSLESLSSSCSKDYNNDGTRIIHRKPSIRSVAGSEPRPAQSSAAHFSCDSSSSDGEMRPGYFLDSCFLCRTRLGAGDDIYMYRGDTPFCSEECRQEQIDIDEAEGRNRGKMVSKKNSKAKIISNSTVSSKSRDMHARAAQTVVAG